MRFLILCILTSFLTGATVVETAAQTRDQQRRTQVDSVLTERYYHTPYDSDYVVRPEGKLTLKHMESGEQKLVTPEELIAQIK